MAQISRAPLFALLAAILLAVPSRTAHAEDEAPTRSKAFETSRFGVRLGFWYEPSLDMKMKVGGSQGLFVQALFGNDHIDVQKDLSVGSESARPVDYLTSFDYGIPEAEVFFDTRLLSVSIWGVSPFRYEGRKQIVRSLTFAGVTFSVTREVETTLDQFLFGVDIKVNIINNELIRLSPVVAIRTLGIAWTLQDRQAGFKATTEDIKGPITFGRWQVLAYPEIGGEIRVGYRSIVEADAKVTAMRIFYGGMEGTTALAEAGVTVYPLAPIDIDLLGIRVGGRYYYLDIRTGTDNPRNEWSANMHILGANLSVIVRF